MNQQTITRSIHKTHPAALANVELICAEIDHLTRGMKLETKDSFAIHILVREALNNAVFHGCQEDEHLTFTCDFAVTPTEVRIMVVDEGPGFNWRVEREKTPDISAESGRGLALYAIYADTIQFNEAGNCVTLTRKLTEDKRMNEYQVVQKDTQATISLGSQLVAADVPQLKSLMKRLISEGTQKLDLDCSQLTLMDSTGIGCLIAAHNSLAKVNGSLSVIGVLPDIHDLLSSMRLDRHFKIIPLAAKQE